MLVELEYLGRTRKEIAGVLGIHRNTVRRIRSRPHVQAAMLNLSQIHAPNPLRYQDHLDRAVCALVALLEDVSLSPAVRIQAAKCLVLLVKPFDKAPRERVGLNKIPGGLMLAKIFLNALPFRSLVVLLIELVVGRHPNLQWLPEVASNVFEDLEDLVADTTPGEGLPSAEYTADIAEKLDAYIDATSPDGWWGDLTDEEQERVLGALITIGFTVSSLSRWLQANPPTKRKPRKGGR